MSTDQPRAGSTGEPSGAPPVGGPDPWQAWATALVESVRALADGESLTVTAPRGAERIRRRRKARLRGFVPAKHELVAPWVRLERVEDLLRGHCVGAEISGGSFPLSPDEEEALLGLGWHRPAPAEGDDYVRFWPDDVPQGPFLPRDEAERAAAVVAATFRDVLMGGEAAGLPAVARDRPAPAPRDP